MNTKALNALADVICRAQANGKRTPMGIAMAIDCAQMFRHPESTTARTSDSELTIYRAVYEHDLIPIGLYTTEKAARQHCEALVSREHPATEALFFDWIGDESDPEEPHELVVTMGSAEQPTGYAVYPVPVADAYDAEAEE
ncbi:hypothetical protein [Streptomyces sp. NPDC096153]|uniref:hypothetical protein n=1 Tax=Streptomyces sp. NPDC096153 TaxID=3155548 RepID=UPI00332E4620